MTTSIVIQSDTVKDTVGVLQVSPLYGVKEIACRFVIRYLDFENQNQNFKVLNDGIRCKLHGKCRISIILEYPA